MSNSILYYPTIEFRHEDYQWLWNAALFADKIYRIVPPGYELNEPRNIRELCSTGEIGIPLSPVPYSKEASEEFSKFMDENHRKAAALSLIEDDETEYIRIHSSKMDGDESVLYLHKLSLMYRIILLDLLDIPLNRYKERLSNRIETINCWWADRCDQ